jgi:FtsP/CotA-like multicopper oxidase with cupredoxin domain
MPLVIQDRSFTNGNQLRYVLNMHQRMRGFLGDTILVNGQENSIFPVKTKAYRLRILNGSNSRIYKLGWDDGTPMIAIGTDGGLLAKPETLPYIMLAPAERVELWVDFSGRKLGSDLTLQSLSYQGAGHMGGGMGRGGMGMMGGGLGPGWSTHHCPVSYHRAGERFPQTAGGARAYASIDPSGHFQSRQNSSDCNRHAAYGIPIEWQDI